jgi:replication initiation protein RepC
MAHAIFPGAGFRRFDAHAAAAETLASQFKGLPEGCQPAHALAALKRAAPYMRLPPSAMQLIDLLFAWTRPQDWEAGETPIVWPRNEKLARKLGIGIRQVQNHLDRALRLGLIAHRDSPNGHRGGFRGEDGRIKWAYGIVLSPIGTRMPEFIAVAKRGEAEDARRELLKKRIVAARRRISSLTQALVDNGFEEHITDDLEFAKTAAVEMRSVRCVIALLDCADALETRSAALEARVKPLLATASLAPSLVVADDIAPTDDLSYMHSTTTTQPLSAKAITSSGCPGGSSGDGRANSDGSGTSVEADLSQHGIDPSFIAAVTPDVCALLGFEQPGWGQLINLADRLVERNGIHRQAWKEACRLMGERGAAASVIATVHKFMAGDVHGPGAYLRGMNQRAARGELNLGRTFHGFKQNTSHPPVRGMQATPESNPLSVIALRAMNKLVLSGTSSR